MLIGYARVSTDDQNLDLQRDALRLAGCEKIYEDRMSGAKAARPGLTMAMEVARSGDVLTVWRLDRLGRSLHDLILLGRKLDETGHRPDERAGEDRYQFERRQAGVPHVRRAWPSSSATWSASEPRPGLTLRVPGAARAAGRRFWIPPSGSLRSKLYAEKQHTIGEICRMMGISKPTLYNYIAEANA